MTQSKETTEAIEPRSSSSPVKKSTKRAQAFRNRLASNKLKRWEVVTTPETISAVRQIATREGMTTSVAGEALLKLGIEAYLAREQANVEVVSCEESISKSEPLRHADLHPTPARVAVFLSASMPPKLATTNYLSEFSSRIAREKPPKSTQAVSPGEHVANGTAAIEASPYGISPSQFRAFLSKK